MVDEYIWKKYLSGIPHDCPVEDTEKLRRKIIDPCTPHA